MRLILTTLLMGALSLVVVQGCSSGSNCTSAASLQCDETEGVTYFVDSCGEREGISKRCDCGCNADRSGCEPCVCDPDCQGRVCGSDGCDGLCPPGCGALEQCTAEGQCVACVPDCDGVVCGPDGCSGQCPPGCAAGESCTPEGTCEVCSPDCVGKQCGSDGCDGQCPPGCDPGQQCNAAGVCVACQTDCIGRECGADGCGGDCPPGCAAGEVCTPVGSCFACTPSCAGRVCGPDGCGGTCGGCGADEACSPTGACESILCTGQASSISGALSSGATGVTFDAAVVLLEHKRDTDEALDGCLSGIDVTLTLAGGCQLHVVARNRFLWQGGMEIQVAEFIADGACPGIAGSDHGAYGGIGGLTTAEITPGIIEVPGDNVASACVATSLLIDLEGILYRTGDNAPLAVAPSQILISGDFNSSGTWLTTCPCFSNCQSRECGDDGCGKECGVCQGTTTYCDENFDCTDDCVGLECGPSPNVGLSCGQCPLVNQICDQGTCRCEFSACGAECCTDDGFCYLGACCAPDCVGKHCGSDGCGGSCGACVGLADCIDGICTNQVEWIAMAPGTYQMGEAAGNPEEAPLHDVTLPAFEIMRTEVTVGQYDECYQAGDCGEPSPGPHCTVGWPPNYPINCISYGDANSYCAFVGGRLPSESEWEYAARSQGQAGTYPWGLDAPNCTLAVMGSDTIADGCGTGDPWPVCSIPPGNTDQGLCDMAGNVAEIVADWYHTSYVGAPADGTVWDEQEPGQPYRVSRGGNWVTTDPDELRTRSRVVFSENWYEPYFGVRCARDIQ